MTRRFLRSERGNVALEGALALGVLVGAFAGLVHIFADAWTEDRAGRAARAVARTLAIDPAADPWAALRREGGLEATATCPAWTAAATSAACGGWTLSVHRGVSPATLDDALDGDATAAGEMVLVHLARTPQAAPNTGNAGNAGNAAATDRKRMAGVGLARREPQG